MASVYIIVHLVLQRCLTCLKNVLLPLSLAKILYTLFDSFDAGENIASVLRRNVFTGYGCTFQFFHVKHGVVVDRRPD